ncbi:MULTISPECIES: MIP/aquaporin family protein [unclassified Cryobacterium]|uniref:MIP/aquaporin family protein n=1 Tax=unclassified Cryobacterium TaxID=2649013 RepID=UPI0034DDC319
MVITGSARRITWTRTPRSPCRSSARRRAVIISAGRDVGHLGLSPRDRGWVHEFNNRNREWTRLGAEMFGTYFLVLVAAGAGTVDSLTHGDVGRGASVTAPGLMVAAIILFMGAVSGAHLNPLVSVAFALRGDFPWRRVPGYVLAQLAGAILASLTLIAVFGPHGGNGETVPGPAFTDSQALVVEALLTMGLVSTILGSASGAQNVGSFSAIAVGGYIILAGLWASPVSGASMNPARTVGPDLVRGDFTHTWVYLLGPSIGTLLAVGSAYFLRGPGGGPTGTKAAQGRTDPEQPSQRHPHPDNRL